ncbi:MAG: endonuclease MutS2, partial [Chloroflexia bacterium]
LDRGSGVGGRGSESAIEPGSRPSSLRSGAGAHTPDPHRGLLFKNARHPLLSGHVVPITVELGDRFRMLVITGPNTGGKTVALKTVGLLTLMAQAGMHLPADQGSRAVVFRDVFADIGDEQSIEQSLSTFSSHMSNIISILKQADRESLVLLDELGAGTDPQEGSALARAIITYILEIGCLAVCTTHYSELKAFAFNTQGVENASVEFDVNTLSPTYRLMIGVPGRSNALAIANRLGLSPQIIDQARRFVDPEAQHVEDLLENIRSEREAARNERGSAEQTRRDLERSRRELEERLADVDELKARAAEEVRAETERELEALRDELRRLRGRVEAGLTATSDEALTRQWVYETQSRTEDMVRQVRTQGERERKKRNRQARPEHRRVETSEPHVFGPGDTVYVQTLGAEGDVIGAPDNSGQVEVQVGAFKVRVPVANLALRRTAASQRSEAARQASNATASRYAAAAPVVAPPLEYDFRGWRAEEAIEEIDRRLDEAAMAGMPFLRIIHGKGTGALRKALREFLTKQPVVKGLETPRPEEGGEGVTIVRL